MDNLIDITDFTSLPDILSYVISFFQILLGKSGKWKWKYSEEVKYFITKGFLGQEK